MSPDELRAIMAFLRERVRLDSEESKSPVVITFLPPTAEDMIGAGLNADGVEQVLSALWWEEMVTDIIETPDFCAPDESPQQVLEYAKDVVSDYIRKRVSLDGRK
ncbi:MAG: hypothetical protein D3924_01195 [Candidatus Electrothrix sp. AR4]|nr:hypothetical protein [Candidatus Electrothrix sp. AR4]